MLRSCSGGLSSPERTAEPQRPGDGDGDGDGASLRPLLAWDRQLSLSSSLDSSSFCSELEIKVELDYRDLHPQSEWEEIPSWRWLSPSLMPRLPVAATPQRGSEETEQVLSTDGPRTAGIDWGLSQQRVVLQVYMTNEKMRTKAMRAAARIAGFSSAAIEGADKDRLVVIGVRMDAVELVIELRKELRKRMGFTFFTVVGLLKRHIGTVKLLSVAPVEGKRVFKLPTVRNSRTGVQPLPHLLVDDASTSNFTAAPSA